MRSKGLSFATNAKLYDQARPGYQATLFDDLQQWSHLDASSKILEVGSGSGQATAGLLKISKNVSCIEPGKELFTLLTAKFPQVRAVNTTFEDYDGPGEFDLIAAATAWHWIDQEVGYKKAHRLLANNGHLAIMRHFHAETDSNSFHIRANELYKKHQPNPDATIKYGYREDLDNEPQMIDNQYFKTVKYVEYPWQQTMSVSEYLALRNTYYEVILMDKAARSKFEKDVQNLAEQEYDGQITLNYVTTLTIARKR